MNPDAIKAIFGKPDKATATDTKELMVFPAGRHTITATRAGAPFTCEVIIDEQTARAMSGALAKHLSASEQKPFFDFDHEEKAASGWPTSFYWKPDGVYASVEWSSGGAAAVSGKDYRSFSPAFFIDDSSPARVTGAPFIMGGLVNDPAFRRIAPLWARDAETKKAPQGEIQKPNTMTPEEIQAAAVKAAADKAIADAAIVAAAHKAESDALKAQVAAAKENEAKAHVNAAVSRGALKLEDTAVQAKWVKAILADAGSVELLASLPGKSVVDLGAAGDKGTIVVSADANLLEAVKAYAAAKDSASKGAIYCRSVRAKMLEVKSGLAEILAANAFGTVTADLIVLRSLDLLKLTFPVLTAITTDFSNLSAKQGEVIRTRIITPPTVVTYNNTTGWASSDATATDVPVTIGQPIGVQISLTTTELAGSNRDLFSEQVEASHYALGKALVDALYALLTQANFSGAAKRTIKALASFARADVVDMGTALAKRGVPAMGRTLLLNSDYFGALNKDSTLVSLSALLGAGSGVIAHRTLPDIADFRVVEAVNLPANAFTSTTGTLQGFGFTRDALVMATRVPEDYTRALPGASNGAVSVITNPDTGISVQKVDFVDNVLARAYSRIAMSYGVAVGQVASGQCLTET